ncbi:MAG: MerR family transcriptional regulator [Acidimicrobiia bacterium]|nr:MAG: MerR family transcriptional regulator [Acidimicrobiia bacterium]
MDPTVTVGELARLAGLTVRTLHHYDEIGLVVPRGRTETGYRLYGDRQIERLQEVLFFRELGFGLDEIREIIGAPGYDRMAALERQRGLLEAKADHLLAMIDAVDTTIEMERNGMKLSKEDMLEVFGDFDPSEHQEETRTRWGETELYEDSARRTARHSKADWQQLHREAEEINRGLVGLMNSGIRADSIETMDLAERHRAHISKWFYDCTPEIHRGLGEMYVADQRFAQTIDRAAPGLAQYLSDAIAANAVRS